MVREKQRGQKQRMKDQDQKRIMSTKKEDQKCSIVPKEKSVVPKKFKCAISDHLMDKPFTIIGTGLVVEESCIQACKDLAYVPPILSKDFDNADDISALPNDSLKASILEWCDETKRRPPFPIPRDAALSAVQNLKNDEMSRRRGLVDNQEPISLSTSAAAPTSASNARDQRLMIGKDPSGGGAERDTHGKSKPARSGGQPSSTAKLPANNSVTEPKILERLTSSKISDQVKALDDLVGFIEARYKKERAIRLCTPRILSAIEPMLNSNVGRPHIQERAVKVMLLFLEEEPNRIKIVQRRAVLLPHLVHVLNNNDTLPQARDDATRASYYLLKQMKEDLDRRPGKKLKKGSSS